jgi:hypothetical protein
MLSFIAGEPAMKLGEPSWWDAANAAVRADLVVVVSPDGDGLARLV